MVEIERKFLVLNQDFKSQANSSFILEQGFLSLDPERTVRVRIKNKQGILTIKGKSNASGTTRNEWEYPIDLAEAQELLALCHCGIIKKERFTIPVGKHTFEVDEFFLENSGLIVAEVELSSEDEPFVKPAWLGKEVTGQIKYYNSQLSINPFKNWT